MNVTVRPLRESDLDAADRIFRLAFGTFLGLPDPSRFAGDADYVRTRWRANPDGAIAAEIDGALVGSNFATRWGSFAFFGPLTVKPDLWNRGVARRLLEPTMNLFTRWQTTHRGLFTFSHSGKHHALYQKFGFYPRFLTAVVGKAVRAIPSPGFRRFSQLPESDRQQALAAAREVTESIYPGLDLTHEIRTTQALRLGDTLFIGERERIDGFAVCHLGAGSEAGGGRCYAKFAAVRCGARAESNFFSLLDACEALAFAEGAQIVIAGVNLARERAYRHLLERGFRADLVGVAMHSPNEPGPNRPEVFALDDWR
jgi:predicted N-acetyltransferase YhbS